MPDAEKIIDTAIQEWDQIALHATPDAPLATHIVRALREAGMLTETEWEYAGIPVTSAGEEWVHRSIEECEDLIHEYANPNHWVYEPQNDDLHPVTTFRRVRRRPAGPWEPVEGDPR